MAWWAEGELLAAERQQAALRAVVAAEAGEAVAKDAAAQVVPERARDEAGERALAAGFEVRLEPLAEELVQRAFARVPALVGERWSTAWRGRRRALHRGCPRQDQGIKLRAQRVCWRTADIRRRPPALDPPRPPPSTNGLASHPSELERGSG